MLYGAGGLAAGALGAGLLGKIINGVEHHGNSGHGSVACFITTFPLVISADGQFRPFTVEEDSAVEDLAEGEACLEAGEEECLAEGAGRVAGCSVAEEGVDTTVGTTVGQSVQHILHPDVITNADVQHLARRRRRLRWTGRRVRRGRVWRRRRGTPRRGRWRGTGWVVNRQAHMSLIFPCL